MRKLKVPSLVTIAILTAITVLFWIAFGVVRIFITKPTPSVPKEILAPVTRDFDKETVAKIESRLYFNKE